MSRQLNDLSKEFRPLAMELLARLTEANIPVKIIDTLRTPAEQAENIRKKVSWTLLSKHLTGDAIDVCPYEVYIHGGTNKLLWAPSPIWTKVGLIGESLGLTWGGRWKVRDLGHFERKS